MIYPFRKQTPVRSLNKNHTDYHQYKESLAQDFHHRCGYTDCSDHWFGGIRSFQIDHFLPVSKYPERKSDYNNLVYCCSYVNRAKWNDDNPLFLDPCIHDYNEHFGRNKEGFIFGKTENGQYMVNKLQLSLARYAIIWNLDQLEERMDLLRKRAKEKPEYEQLLSNLALLYVDYIKSLRMHL